MKRKFIIGAVAYAPKVVTIWEGFKVYFEKNGMETDYLLFSNYESQVDALFNGQIDAAWNSPLAWIRAERMGKYRGTPVGIGPMRDTDQDLFSVLIVLDQSGYQSTSDLVGKKIGFGAMDSPQARLIPLEHLAQVGLKDNFKIRIFDKLLGKHGDHIGGERDAAEALIAGQIDAAWMIAGNYQAFMDEGLLPKNETKVLTKTNPFDHCIFNYAPTASKSACERFTELLLQMKWTDPEVRPLLELEGLKEWKMGRTSGFTLLDKAVDSTRFYDTKGEVLA